MPSLKELKAGQTGSPSPLSNKCSDELYRTRHLRNKVFVDGVSRSRKMVSNPGDAERQSVLSLSPAPVVRGYLDG